MKGRFLNRNLGFVLLLFAAQSIAQDSVSKKELARCAAEKQTVKRLACYDDLAKKLNVDKPIADTSTVGKWRVQKDISPIDDSVRAYLFLEASDSIRDKYGRGNIHPMMVVRCAENTTSLYINWGTFIGTDSTEVVYRLDKDKARTQSWSISTDHNAVGRWNGGSSIPLIKSMFGKSNMYVGVTPFSESPVAVNFAISGLEKAVEPLREACHW